MYVNVIESIPRKISRTCTITRYLETNANKDAGSATDALSRRTQLRGSVTGIAGMQG